MTHDFHHAQELFKSRDYDGCAALCRRLLDQTPDDIPVLHLLGSALIRVGRGPEGAAVLAAALERSPADLTLRADCALALSELGQLDRAIAVLAEGARYHPGSPDLAARLARLLTSHGRHDDARRVLTAALQARPDHLELRGLLAAELAADLRIPDALRHLRLLTALLPGQSPVYANVGVLLQSLGETGAAIRSYRRAVALDPANHVAQVNLGTALMTEGDYAEGWSRYEHRLALPDMRLPPPTLPRWQGGEPTGKTLLVTAEQGYGDLIQFARFLPVLAARAEAVWLECPVEMKRLFSGLRGLAGVVSPGDDIPAVDAVLPLLSLPLLLNSGADLRAGSIPYLPVPVPGPGLPPDRRPRIGLVWAGRPAKGELFIRRMLGRRSCRFADLAPLWSRDEFCWFSMQMGDAAQERREPVIDLAPWIGDFADSAVLISQLDLLISIDSAPAHLAGALGVPLWVMLGPGQADYRWNGTQGQSPWYPDARLFRAGQAGWPALATEIAAALDSLSFA